MKIEPLEPERIGSVVALSLLAWAPVFESIAKVLSPEAFSESYPEGWRAAQGAAVRDACRSDAMNVWTANDGEATLGFVAVRMEHATKTGEIYMLAVDPAHQRRGIALELTNFAVERMREAGMTTAVIETGADEGHAPARRTYEKAGFAAWPAVKFFKSL